VISLIKGKVHLNLILDLGQYFGHVGWSDDVHDGDDTDQLHDVVERPELLHEVGYHSSTLAALSAEVDNAMST
jgi:hypothetical protein